SASLEVSKVGFSRVVGRGLISRSRATTRGARPPQPWWGCSMGVEQTAFRHRNLLVSKLTQFYYAVLNDDPEKVGFPAALAEFGHKVEAVVPIAEAIRQHRADVLAVPPWQLAAWF